MACWALMEGAEGGGGVSEGEQQSVKDKGSFWTRIATFHVLRVIASCVELNGQPHWVQMPERVTSRERASGDGRCRSTTAGNGG